MVGLLLSKRTTENGKVCHDCEHQHTMNCPNSSECYDTKDKPYFLKKGIQNGKVLWKGRLR